MSLQNSWPIFLKTVSIVSPSICHELMGPDAMILVFWMVHFKPAFHSPLSLSSRGTLVPLHFQPWGWCHLRSVQSLSRVRPCATPEMAPRQAPSSLGFSRQEHWSGLPFPSPVQESEKWKKSLSCVWLLATPWTVAHQAPLPTGFSRQEYTCYYI